MTRAPANLLAVRSLLLQHLNIKPSDVSGDLESNEVGIVGDPNHRGGYHCGSDRLDSDDYSVRESPRDRAGLTLDAAALDVGWFEIRSGGAVHNMRTFAVWCVNQCRANTPDSRDIREIIYSPDGKSVRRWDRLGKRTTGDSSHLEHDHFSFFRDAIKAGRDQRPLFRRYLTEIGLIASAKEPDVELTDQFDPKGLAGWNRRSVQDLLINLAQERGFLVADPSLPEDGAPPAGSPLAKLAAMANAFPALAAQVATLAGKDFTDEPAIVAGVLAGLDPSAIAAAIPTDLAQRVADELAARLSRNPT